MENEIENIDNGDKKCNKVKINKYDNEGRELMMDKRDIREMLTRITPRPMLFFDVEVTEHCNLNCKGCGSFAPIADEHYLDVTGYIKDMKRLSLLANGEAHHINILGGEPLLHPDIIEIMHITRDFFPVGNVYLVTNGILLLEMPEKFWVECHNSSIIVAPTKYPIELDWTKIEDRALKYSVVVEYFNDISKSGWNRYAFEPKGNRYEGHNFISCSNANMCTVLYEGKLYPCPVPAKIKYINKEFNENFKVSERDYIDIYKVSSLKEIMEFLSRPIPFCRYCNVFKCENQDWEVSKKEKEEWIW